MEEMKPNEPFLAIVLKANGQDRIELHRDEPLTLTVSLSNPDAVYASSHNLALQSQMAYLRERLEAGEINHEEYERETGRLEAQKMQVGLLVLGTQDRAWYSQIKLFSVADKELKELGWGLHLLSYFPSGAVVTLDEVTSGFVELVLDPEDVARLKPGKYKLIAVIELPPPQPRHYESNTVEIDILETELPEDTKEQEVYLTALSNYYLKRGALDKTFALVQKILARNAHSINGFVLLGKLNEAKGDYRAALEAFQKALEEFKLQHPEHYEGPRYLVSQILRLEDLIERSASG